MNNMDPDFKRFLEQFKKSDNDNKIITHIIPKHGSYCIDQDNINEINAAAQRFNANIEVLVEIDIGAGRCGVAPGKAAVELAKSISKNSNLTFGGLQAYQGKAQHIRGFGERKIAIEKAGKLVKETLHLLSEADFECRLVTGA